MRDLNGKGSFRPRVVSPVGHFALGRFAHGLFRQYFYSGPMIEVGYILVYKEVRGREGGVWGVDVRLFIALACLFNIYYL